MDFLKKARSQVKSAVKDIQNQSQGNQQYQQQQQQPFQQPGYQPPPAAVFTKSTPAYQGPNTGSGSQYSQPQAHETQNQGPSWHYGNSVLFVGQQQRLHVNSDPGSRMVPFPLPQGYVQNHQHAPPQFYPPPPQYQSGIQDYSPQSPETGPLCEARELELIDHIQFYILQSECLSAPGKSDIDGGAIAFCRTCFSTRIFPHQQLATHFKPLLRDPLPPGSDQSRPNLGHEQQVCAYSLPRVRQTIQRECIPQKSLDPLLDYARLASSMPDCSGSLISDPVEYYASDHIKGLAICKLCFENFFRKTSFEYGLTKHDATQDFQWYCDIGMKKYIYRLLTAELDKPYPNFGYFAAKATERLALPGCPGDGSPLAPKGSGQAFAYEAVNGKSGNLCLECFYDNVAGTTLEKAFSSRFMLNDDQKGDLVCDLSSPFSQFAMGVANKFGNDEVWRKSVSMRVQLPACVGLVGIDEATLQPDHATWYYFSAQPSIEVCPFCYATYAELLGAGHLFSPITRPLKPNVIRMCYLSPPKNPSADVSDSDNFENTLVWRGMLLRHAISHGYGSGSNWTELEYTANMIAGWKVPCGSSVRAFKTGSGRHWLGRRGSLPPVDSHDFTLAVCEECHDWYIKGSKLEAELSSDVTANTLGAVDGFVCNTPKKPSRDVLEEACKRGDWSHFAEFWLKREEIRARYEAAGQILKQQIERQNQANMATQMQIMAQTQMQQLQLMQQLNSQQNAMMIGIGGSMAEAVTTDYGQRYGNSTVGYGFLSQAGAAAAQAQHDVLNSSGPQMQVSLENFNFSGNVTHDTKEMLKLYEVIETEWRAVE